MKGKYKEKNYKKQRNEEHYLSPFILFPQPNIDIKFF